jgi:anti-sigma factor RsiW
MRCRSILRRLNAYSDGELPERERLSVEEHLASCGSCRARLEEIRETVAMLRGNLPVPPVPDELFARITAKAETASRREVSDGRFPSRLIAGFSTRMRIAACAAAIMGFAAGLSLDGGWTSVREIGIEPEGSTFGLEWFEPAPPGSLVSIYEALTAPRCDGEAGER